MHQACETYLKSADSFQVKERCWRVELFQLVSGTVFFCSMFFFGQSAIAGCSSFSRLITNGSYAVADAQGKVYAGCNIDTPFVPASILKISTALSALSLLGADFRFTTQFFTDEQDNLYIRGTGDPLLISEEINLIYAALQERGVRRINSIFIDPSNFALEHQVPGQENSSNPYDAPVGPVVVNFNSVGVKVSRRRDITSSEPQTPMLPIMKRMAAGYLPGRYRINICSGGCVPDTQMAMYTTELFRALQNQTGIPGTGDAGIKSVPAHATLVYTHKNTNDLEYLISTMLKYSSNFIANLIYLRCGTARFGFPATWQKADKAVHEEIKRQLGSEAAGTIIQQDGAGLSRNNRVTARTMLTLLAAFRPYVALMAKKMGVPTKSGSMKGIYNYAGYLKDGGCYVVMLNQSKNMRNTILKKVLQHNFPTANIGRR